LALKFVFSQNSDKMVKKEIVVQRSKNKMDNTTKSEYNNNARMINREYSSVLTSLNICPPYICFLPRVKWNTALDKHFSEHGCS
jgi:hypothetical protein